MEINARIERLIVTGMIISDDFLSQLIPMWNPSLLKGTVSKRISKWCVDYFEEYGQAPGQTIEHLYIEKLKKEKLDEDQAEEIEDLLEDLSDEYDRDTFNVRYLLQKAQEYFFERNIEEHQKEVQKLLDAGEVQAANELAAKYAPLTNEAADNGFDLSDADQLEEKIEYMFSENSEPLFKLPGVIGEMMNEFFVRDSFVALLAPEKTGKSMWLLQLAIQASKHGCNVAFFQAGDMSESQQLRRIAINRTKKNTQQQYSGKQFVPVKDCIHNQLDECSLPERESLTGIFDEKDVKSRKDVTKDLILEAREDNADYNPCSNCLKYRTHKYGSPWLVERDFGDPLTKQEAKKKLNEFFVKKKKRFKLKTYPSETLTVKEIERQLDVWEKEGFITDLIVIDYADIMNDFTVKDFRQKQNAIWSGLRGLSQKKHSMVLSATQGDADSYDSKKLLTKKNFTEDKRKLAHITAVFGLNQSPVQKAMKIMEVNKIAVREGECDPFETVTVLQDPAHSTPILTSYR